MSLAHGIWHMAHGMAHGIFDCHATPKTQYSCGFRGDKTHFGTWHTASSNFENKINFKNEKN